APEASLNSIRQVLNAIAQRMDPEEDILWLHLTSHGAESNELVLSYPGRDLYWLTPSHLRRLMDETRIRHRIVVVSACYSGGFVAPLASPDTLVATASSSTRQAYGCGSASNITDFSKALYLEALPKIRYVPEAMRRAQQIIHEEETTHQKAHSYPQVRSGAAIEMLLRELSKR
ncbi:MAG: peptidase C13, partial [Proteobacteria bacterium]